MVCQLSKIMLAMDISISMIDDEDDLDRILQNTNLDEFEQTDRLQNQLDSLSKEEPSVRLAPTMDTNSTPGLAPRKGSNTELCSGVDTC